MGEPIDELEALPVPVRVRLDGFSGRLERLGVEHFRMLAARPLDETAHRSAVEDAERLAEERGRGRAVRAARRTIEQWVLRAYGDWQYQPTIAGLNWGRSMGTVEDRAEVVRSLREAVTALVLWDLLPEDERDELLGPWASLAE